MRLLEKSPVKLLKRLHVEAYYPGKYNKHLVAGAADGVK